ncbi:MAG: transporter permease [Aeromicrobium sp.]|jgi:ribose transport system permease protein|nr:transporter permease [Aeromicrobium sp.]
MTQVSKTMVTRPDDTASSRPDAGRARSGVRRVGEAVALYAPVLMLVVLVIVASVLNDRFWAPENLRNMLTQNSALALVAFGMTLVIIAGVFDLSVGAIFAAGSVIFAMLSNEVLLLPAALITVVVGALAGAVNAYVVNSLRVNSFIGTLATGAVFSGLVYILCDSSPVQARREGFETLGLGRIAGVPCALIVAVAAFGLCAALLNGTIFGRYVFAVGGNAAAAHLTGVPVRAVRAACFVLVGALAALGGMITGSQLGLGQPTLGSNIALDAFAVVVIGGTSVYGGRGALWRTASAVLVLATLTNIFNALAWDTTRQSVAKGLIIIAAVALDAARSRSDHA